MESTAVRGASPPAQNTALEEGRPALGPLDGAVRVMAALTVRAVLRVGLWGLGGGVDGIGGDGIGNVGEPAL